MEGIFLGWVCAQELHLTDLQLSDWDDPIGVEPLLRFGFTLKTSLCDKRRMCLLFGEEEN